MSFTVSFDALNVLDSSDPVSLDVLDVLALSFCVCFDSLNVLDYSDPVSLDALDVQDWPVRFTGCAGRSRLACSFHWMRWTFKTGLFVSLLRWTCKTGLFVSLLRWKF